MIFDKRYSEDCDRNEYLRQVDAGEVSESISFEDWVTSHTVKSRIEYITIQGPQHQGPPIHGTIDYYRAKKDGE